MCTERDKPFHPGRLGMLISDGHVSTVPRQLGLTRSKGVFWLATRSQQVGEWQHAGSLYRKYESSKQRSIQRYVRDADLLRSQCNH